VIDECRDKRAIKVRVGIYQAGDYKVILGVQHTIHGARLDLPTFGAVGYLDDTVALYDKRTPLSPDIISFRSHDHAPADK
jgi:hypothetical protein